MGQQDALAATTREIDAAGPLPHPKLPAIRPIIEQAPDAQSDLPVHGEIVAVTGLHPSVVLRALGNELAQGRASQVDGLMTMGPVAPASG